MTAKSPAHAESEAVKRAGKVTDSYTMGKTIGSGSYSVVREGVNKRTKEKFAIKCIKRSDLSDEDEEAIMTEVSILQQMKHPNIMTLREFFEEPEYYYLVTEFVGGGELFDRIVEKVCVSAVHGRRFVWLTYLSSIVLLLGEGSA